MIMLNSPVWKRLTSAGSHADGILQDLLEGRGEFHENMENLGEDLSHQLSWYSATSSTWEEGPGACACGWEDETISFLETPEYFEPAEIGLWDRQSLEKEAVWLNGLLSLIGDEMISPILPLVYGTGICPECGKREPYWSWMDRFAEEC